MPFVKIGLAVVLLGPLSFVTFMMFKVWPFGADVPLLRTPEWKDKHIGELYSGRLQLRRETEAGGALLLKRVDLERGLSIRPADTHSQRRHGYGMAQRNWTRGPLYGPTR